MYTQVHKGASTIHTHIRTYMHMNTHVTMRTDTYITTVDEKKSGVRTLSVPSLTEIDVGVRVGSLWAMRGTCFRRCSRRCQT
jgi:hypothetical protein